MRRFALIASVLLLGGCSNAPGPQPVNEAPSQTPAKQMPMGPAGANPHASPGSAEASAEAPDQPLDEKVAQLRAAYEKNPNDTAAKKALEEATFQNAQFYMYKSPLPPGQKYPKALALYREVLKLDPANQDAQKAADLIESIYAQLGKPVPQA